MGAAAIAVGGLLIAFSGGNPVLIAVGVFALFFGVYVFAQYWLPWLPLLPAPHEREPEARPKRTAAHKLAKQFLKEDGLWPPWWKFWGRGGLTWAQYEALRAKEIAHQQAEERAAAQKVAPSEAAPISQEVLARRIARVAELSMSGAALKTIDELLRRGGALRVKAISPPAVDPYEQRYRPGALGGPSDAVFRALGAALMPPYEVNQWLESVARFVEGQYPEFADRIVPQALPKGEPQAIVAAIDQNIGVLRLIKSGLET